MGALPGTTLMQKSAEYWKTLVLHGNKEAYISVFLTLTLFPGSFCKLLFNTYLRFLILGFG